MKETVSAQSDCLLELSGLSRTFGGSGGVTNVSLCVPPASIYVLCGANGAGKTTTMSVLAGLLFASVGRLFLDHQQIPLDREARRPGLGFVQDDPYLDPDLTPEQWLGFLRALKQCEGYVDARETADALRLSSSELRSRIGELSFGTRRKVALWTEFASTGRLLLLDEPLIGLDPPSIAGFRDVAAQFATGGRSILMSTHLLAEAETIATHVGIMSDGGNVREGTLSKMVGSGSLLQSFLQGTEGTREGTER